MAKIITDVGLDVWNDWESGQFFWLLCGPSFIPSRDQTFVDPDVIDEIVDAGYTRQYLDTPARTINTTDHQIEYAIDGLNLGPITTSVPYQYLVLCKEPPSAPTDTNTLVVASWDIGFTVADGLDVQPPLDAGGIVHYALQAP